MTLILAGGIVAADGISGPRSLAVDGGRITAIEEGVPGIAAGADAIDARDLVVGAGLIDIHTHGIAGAQAIDGGAATIAAMSAAYARHGVTGFLATIGGSIESIERGILGVVDFLEGSGHETGIARCLGVHLEGPFINPARPGAFVPSTIRAPDVGLLERFAKLANGSLRRMTVAPELPGMADLLGAAAGLGIRCSAGHSEASDVEIDEAIGAGVRSVSHTFNAMPPLHHRQPGLLGMALTDERLTAELIVDGIHVHPIAMRLLSLGRGWTGIALITDSIGAAGLADGTYELEEQVITVRGGEARLADGTLAGSTLTLDDGVRRFADAARIPWHQAHASASLVPARLLGIDDRMGRVDVGYDADLVAFDDHRRVVWTMVAGRVVHRV